MSKPRVEIHDTKIVLYQPTASLIRAAGKAIFAATGERPLLGVTGYFPSKAVKSGRVLDLRPFPSNPGEVWTVQVFEHAPRSIQVGVLGAWEEVTPELGVDVVVTLEMP